jgi:AraC family transcriptional regulator
MVCDRCRRTVKQRLEGLGLTIGAVDLGRAEVLNWPDNVPEQAVREALQAEGFALLTDPKAALVEQIKTLLISEVHYRSARPAHQNVSDFLSEKMGYDYAYLSQMFSAQVGTTIERFLISQKIERAKELLQDGQQPIADIAFALGYSSVPHFTNQFKSMTGQTPGQFRKAPIGRQVLDGV